MKKRLFIGFPVTLNASLKATIKRTRINADKKEMEFYWIPDENMHVTLNFIGETPVERLPALVELLSSVARNLAPVKTSLKGMGAFPDERHMRVLWIGVRRSRALHALHESLREALIEQGFPQEDRDYAPHLTIGRLRKTRTATDLISPYVRTSFEDLAVGSIVLFESVLQGSHPVYKNLGEFTLTGRVDDEESVEP